MSEKYPGGFVTYNPPTPSQTSATGIWTLSQQEQYQQAGLWPNAPSQISRSLRFNQADSTYLSRTPTYAGNLKTWTWSAWVKRTNLSDYQYSLFGASVTSANYDEFRFNTSDQFRFFIVSSSSIVLDLITTQVFRDPSAWYHFVVAYDSTQATSSDRAKLYVNGVQVTSFATATYPSQNQNTTINSNALARIGLSQSSFLLNCYMANVQFVDGQALTPSSFGETNANTGIWQPLQKNLTYGTNGFQLTFNDNTNTTATTLGADSSGNGNNWTPSNFSVAAGAGNDSMVDSPTSYGTDTGVGGQVRGNYCTLNPLVFTNGYATLSNGNLDVVPDSTHYPMVTGTFGMTSGKWYWEYTLGASGNGGRLLGIATSAASNTTYLGGTSSGWGYYGGNGDKYTNNANAAYGASYTNGDVIGVAFDADAGTLVFYKNGTSQGTAYSSLTSGPYFPAWSAGDAGQTGTTSLNFGQRPFAYTAPSGYKALCTQNLPTPTIGATSTTLATQYFGAFTYTGNGSASSNTTQNITTPFYPDLIWVKGRDSTYYHRLTSTGITLPNYLATNATDAVSSGQDQISALASTYFQVKASGSGGTNQSGSTYVGWAWNANSGATVSNTSGTITSTVSANTASGFSVVTYTGNGIAGATIGHGLGVAPSMMFIKGRTNVDNWHVYSSALGNTGGLFLNLTDSFTVSTYFWNNTSPTSTVFTVSSGSSNNSSGINYVAYCFAEVAGYSKFGSYVGNGAADGAFVYTGFKPAFILFKRTSTAGNSWRVTDSTRSTYNLDGTAFIYPDTTGTENSNANDGLDILSNGFKMRTSNDPSNASGSTYIYMAFASNPFKYSLAR